MQLTVSVPGKIHLLGEHAVVYGRPALLAAINRRLYLTLISRNISISKNRSLEEVINFDNKPLSGVVKEAVKVFSKKFSFTNPSACRLTVSSSIEIGCGLGSSAAITVATLAALMRFYKNIWNPALVNELAYEVEKKQHGNPSGADNSVVTMGGLLYFRREFEFLKSLWSLPITSYKIPPFILINSGRPVESTGEMIRQVKALYDKNPAFLEKIFTDQEFQTKSLVLGLKTGNLENIKKAIISAEKNLEKMGVVGKLAISLIDDLKRKNIAAKICGAGGRKTGSGMILCLSQNLSLIREIVRKYGLDFYPIMAPEEGLRLEKIVHKVESS